MSKLINQLKQLQADAEVFYHKLHNFHWNIQGMEFYHLHLKTEEFYNTFAVCFDDLAELQLQRGYKPVVTLKEALEITQIKEESKTAFTAPYLIESVLNDFEYFCREFKALSQMANGDASVIAYADGQVSILEKEIWMLKSMLSK